MTTARSAGLPKLEDVACVNTKPLLRAATAVGAVGLFLACWHAFATHAPASQPVMGALAGGLIAAAATAVGTLPVLLSTQLSRRASRIMLGFGAGVMLAASIFSLIVPALHQARLQGASAWTASMLVSTGILLGATLLLMLGKAFSPRHPDGDAIAGIDVAATRRAWLFIAAITLHNIPEGAAIGVAFAGMDRAGAVGLATGIGIQDIPEGLAVAVTLRAVGYRRALAVLAGVASGLVEPMFSVLSATVVAASATLLPWGLAGAAGAMLFVIAHDVIPETHRDGHGTAGSVALMIGFVAMLVLDNALS